jgi:hypothetical protein
VIAPNRPNLKSLPQMNADTRAYERIFTPHTRGAEESETWLMPRPERCHNVV